MANAEAPKMDLTNNMAEFRSVMGFDAGNEVMYEDDENDFTVPNVQKVTKANNILPLWGNTTTMNLNTLVLENIVQSTYYKNYLAEMTLYQQVADAALYKVSHLEPWERGTRKTQGMTGMCGGVRGVGAGGVISTAFCCTYKMFVLRMTRKQLVGMINSSQSAFMRGIGFLYIRYTQPPVDLWSWFEPYLDDDEEIDPKAGGGDPMTIGGMLRIMLTKLDWYGTLFPRIPVPIQKDLEQKFKEHFAAMNPDVERKRAYQPDRERSTSSAPKRSRCGHHLRHHHCPKHRQRCPTKAKRHKAEKEAAESDASHAQKAA